MSPIYVPGKLTLDNGTRAAAIAGVSPTLDYRFAREKREIEAVSLTDKLTYTGGNGTFVGSDGFIQRATTNLPRFDHDSTSRASKGLLLEPARTNVLLRSQNLDNTVWNNSGGFGNTMTATGDYALAPDGTFTATRLSGTLTASQARRAQGLSLLANQTYTYSIFLKALTAKIYNFNFSVNVSPYPGIGYDFVNDLPTPGTTATKYANGWVKIQGSTSLNATNTSCAVLFSGSNGESYDLLAWGAQIELGDSLTSYIPTFSTTATRTVDSASVQGTGVITGDYTLVEKPEGCAVVSSGNILLNTGYTAERVMVFPVALSAQQITDIRSAM